MLASVVFPREISYVPKRCHVPRSAAYLDSAVVEIEEVAVKDSPLAYRVGHPGATTDRGPFPRPLMPRDIVVHRGRLFWSLLDTFGVREMRPDILLGELAKDMGAHTYPLKRATSFVPDALHLLTLLDPCRREEWPRTRFEDVADVKRVTSDNIDNCMAHLQRRAADLILRDGRLFVAGGEPVWDLHTERFMVVNDTCGVALTVKDHNKAMARDLTPFLSYELFTIDRPSDAIARREHLRVTEAARPAEEGDGVIEDFGIHRPATDVLTPMLRSLAETIISYVDYELSALRRETPWHHDRKRTRPTDDDLLRSASAPGWLEAFAAARVAKHETATAQEIFATLAGLDAVLRECNLTTDIMGLATTNQVAVKRAVERCVSDGVTTPATTDEEDAALARVA